MLEFKFVRNFWPAVLDLALCFTADSPEGMAGFPGQGDFITPLRQEMPWSRTLPL
jgi:hypothetical protein